MVSLKLLTELSQWQENYLLATQLYPKLTRDEYNQHLSKQQGYRQIIATEDGKTVGMIGFSPKEFMGEQPYMYICNLVVDKTLRSKGIGSRLVREVERIATTEKFRHIYFEIYENPKLEDFYRKLGYQAPGKWMCRDLSTDFLFNNTPSLTAHFQSLINKDAKLSKADVIPVIESPSYRPIKRS